jgi:hypothetical protein
MQLAVGGVSDAPPDEFIDRLLDAIRSLKVDCPPATHLPASSWLLPRPRWLHHQVNTGGAAAEGGQQRHGQREDEAQQRQASAQRTWSHERTSWRWRRKWLSRQASRRERQRSERGSEAVLAARCSRSHQPGEMWRPMRHFRIRFLSSPSPPTPPRGPARIEWS